MAALVDQCSELIVKSGAIPPDNTLRKSCCELTVLLHCILEIREAGTMWFALQRARPAIKREEADI
jgi:hypothetical protein